MNDVSESKKLVARRHSPTKAASTNLVAIMRVAPPVTIQRTTVAKVSHTLTVALAERLEVFAFHQRISESAVIEQSLINFFALSKDDVELGDQLRSHGARRRRKA